jgi:hypothetical protein
MLNGLGGIMLDTSKLFEVVGGEAEEQESIIDRLRFDDSLNVPIELTDADLWTNYINEDLYEMDKKVREFLKSTRYTRQKKGGYRTTASLVFAWIYGRKPEPSDSAACRMLNELLKYYCTNYTGATTYMGKKVPRVYEFSKYAFSKKRPYSLKLRLEECDDGKNPWRRAPGYNKEKRRNGRRKHSENG